jgi:hypothetical protein
MTVAEAMAAVAPVAAAMVLMSVEATTKAVMTAMANGSNSDSSTRGIDENGGSGDGDEGKQSTKS